MDLHESLAAALRSRGKARRPRNEMQKKKQKYYLKYEKLF